MHGERLKELRLNLRLTQDDIADAVGTTRKTVFSWEKGAIPNGEFLAKLAKALNTSADFLLGLTDDPRPLHEMHRDLSPAEWEIIHSLRDGDWKNALRLISSE